MMGSCLDQSTWTPKRPLAMFTYQAVGDARAETLKAAGTEMRLERFGLGSPDHGCKQDDTAHNEGGSTTNSHR